MQNKKISRKIISLVLSLLMILTAIPAMSLTAYADNTETLLTTITATGVGQASYSKENVATVSFDGADDYMGNGWTGMSGSVTVNAAEGYTITKCVFYTPDGNSTDDAAPFTIRFSRLRPRVTKVEVYGYSNTSAVSTSYVDGSGTSQTADATELEATTTNWTDGSWYIVPAGGLTISGRITVNGTVNLILRDGATLTAKAGIRTTGATLNIYAQSAGTGALTATGSNGDITDGGSAGIGGNGKVGTDGDGYPIAGAGGTVNIYGGAVTATGGNGGQYSGGGAGIGGGGLGWKSTGGGCGTVSIYGGTVTATGGSGMNTAPGIGGGAAGYGSSAGAAGTLTLGKGVKLYNGTDNTGTVLDDSDSESRSYSGSRVKNMFAEFISVDSVDKTALNDAITAAETLYDSIKDDTDYSTIASTLKTAIDAAKEVADSDEADQDAVDTANGAISDATTAAVVGMINALPASTEVTTSDKDKIEKVRAAYDNLTDEQKDSVDTDTLKKLTDAETTLQDAVDTEAAQGATNTINALPAADEVTTADKDAIEAARKAYNDLTDDQKKKVSDDTLKKLTDAEDALKAATVSETIDAIPATDEITLEDKDAVETARAAYDALTDDQKTYVDEDTVKKLTDAEKAIEDLETAKAVTDSINDLPAAADVTLENKDAVEASRTAYDALTDDQKALVSEDTLKKLTDAEKAIADLEAAKSVTDSINDLPDTITLDDKADVEAARAAYDALSDDQKALVDQDTVDKLTAAETALAKVLADKQAADDATALVDALPKNVTISDIKEVKAAREAYDALTDDQKAYVDQDTVDKLTAAEKRITDQQAALPVISKISRLPNKVTLQDKGDILAARAAYDALTDDQKHWVNVSTLKKLTDAETAIANIEAAAAVTDTINALPENVSIDDKDQIEAARAAYDALTDDQKALVDEDTVKKLTDAEEKLAESQSLFEDLSAAMAVVFKISELPTDVTYKDRDAIEDARAAYEALTDSQKALISDEVLKKLTDAEDALAETEKASIVTDQINDLPAVDDITLEDKDDIEAARAAYDALTDEQKSQVEEETLKKLTDAEAVIADLVAAKGADDKINALPAADEITLDDKADVEAAREAYDALSDDQKALVDEDTVKKLTDAETAIENLEAAKAATDKIDEIPDDVTLDDKETVEAAREAYDALSDDQKALVDEDTVKKLTDAETTIENLEAAKAATDKIDEIPDEVTLNDKETVEAAKEVYDKLTEDQKALVDEDTVKKLTDAEKAIADLEAAKAATDKIDAIPDEVTLNDKETVEAAREAYDALSDDQKALVDEDTVNKLTDAETAIENLEAAKAATDKINAIPATDEIALDDKADVEAAREAYDALTDDQKDLVDEDTVKKLTDAEKEIADLEAAKAVADEINDLPATKEITLDDKADVEAAREAYDALTDDQKAKVDKDTVKKLTDAEERETVLQAASEVSAKTGSDATYNGDEIRLVNAPTTELPEGYTMQYALGTDPTTAPADDQYGSEIPTAKDAGTYYVWSKVAGDDEHTGTEAECKTVNLAKAVLTVTAKNQTVNYGSSVAQGKYTVKGLAEGDTVDVKLYGKIATNEVKSTVTASSNYTVKKVSGILTIKLSPIARAVPSGKNLTVKYTKVQNADGYDIYAGYCGTSSYPLAKSIKGNTVYSTTLTKIGGKAIDTKKNVFLYVVAYKNVNGKKVTLVRSASLHIAGANSTRTNVKSVKVAKTAISLKKGKTTTLKPTVTLVNNKKHAISCTNQVRYASCNKSIATVDANGKITAVAPGTVNIYAYASNGVRVKIVVTVK